MQLVWLGIQSSYSHSSLALPLLANACARVPGWTWRLVSGVLGDDAFEIARAVLAGNPDLVCTSLYLFNRELTLEVLARVKELKPTVKIAVGGPECLGEGAGELLESCSMVDVAMSGEGEATMPRLLETFGQWERHVVESGCYMDWPEAPFPCTSGFFDASKPFALLETSRGCPMGCMYCTSCHTHVRLRELSRVHEELTLLHGKGVREVRLLDRTFNLPDVRGAALLKMFREDFPDMRFHLEIHPGVLGPLVREELMKAPRGLLHIESGIQTLNHAALAAVGRSVDTEAALAGLEFLVGIRMFDTHCDLLTGLPEQMFDDVLSDTGRLLEIGPAEIQMEALKMLPGTVLRHEAKERGMVFSPRPPYDVMATPTMSVEDMHRCRVLSRVLDMFHNAVSLRNVFRTAYLEHHEFVRELLGWCEERHVVEQPLGLRRRFELLDEFFTSRTYQQASDALAVAWMLEAFPTGRGPGRRASLVPAIPAEAVLQFGEEAHRERKGTRLWQLPLAQGTAYFVYDRALAPNYAIAWFLG